MKHERKQLSMDNLITSVSKEFATIKDHQKRSQYSIKDCLLTGLGMFYLKMNSMLQFITAVKNEALCKNLMNLYGVSAIPSDTHFRVRLDDIGYDRLQYAYDGIIRKLQRAKLLENFRYYEDYYLLAIDGTGYFSSDTVHCKNCCVKHHKKGGESYYHQVLSAVLVSPGIKEVLPVAIEPIIKQDGDVKNDCERNAARRLLATVRKSHPNLKIIVVMDALYANGPLIKLLNELDLRYIITGKNLEHMYDEFQHSGKAMNYQVNISNGIAQYKFANQLELNATCHQTLVNYVEYHESGGKKEFFSSWITDINLSKENVTKIVTCGRARWCIENQTFNTLKNQGYNFEHNFGHGYNNLSVVMCHLMFIAFLIDQVQAYCGYYFKQALKLVHAKKYIWEKIRSIFTMVAVDSWEQFYSTMIHMFGGILEPPPLLE